MCYLHLPDRESHAQNGFLWFPAVTEESLSVFEAIVTTNTKPDVRVFDSIYRDFLLFLTRLGVQLGKPTQNDLFTTFQNNFDQAMSYSGYGIK